MAACQVEYGRLLEKREGDASQVVSALLARPDSPHERELLESDPWVPRVLDAFAQETEHEGLIKRARKLLTAGPRRLASQAKEGMRKASALMGRESERPAGPPEPARSSSTIWAVSHGRSRSSRPNSGRRLERRLR